MNNLTTAIRLCLFAIAPALVLAACFVDEIRDCRDVCDRYSECVEDINVTECRRRCEDDSRESATFDASIERCDDCIRGKSCSDADACWEDCPISPVPD